MPVLQEKVDGTLRTATVNFGGFEVFDGGKIVSEMGKTRSPGERFARPVPANPSIDTITLTRDWEDARDGLAYSQLAAIIGTDEVFSVGLVIRDGRNNPTRVITFTAKISGLDGPKGNTMGGTDKSTLVVELDPYNVAA